VTLPYIVTTFRDTNYTGGKSNDIHIVELQIQELRI